MIYRLLHLVFIVSVLSITSFAQASKLEGNLYDDRKRPVRRIAIEALPADAVVTDSNGYFRLLFKDFGPGQPVDIVIGLADWAVFVPLFGRDATQDFNLYRKKHDVYIAVKNSELLLEPERISKLIGYLKNEGAKANNRVVNVELQNRALKRENVSLNSQLAAATEREREGREITAFLDEYASFYGFTKAQVVNAVREWAKTNPKDSKGERALKKLWNGDNKGAGDLALAGAEETKVEINRGSKEREENIRKYIGDISTAIVAAYKDNNFGRALERYRLLEQFFRDERISTGEFAAELATAKFLMANSKASLAGSSQGAEKSRLLTEAIAEYRQILTLYTPEHSPREWALTQTNLGNALQDLVYLVGGPDSFKHLKEAEAAYKEAIKSRPRLPFPRTCGCSEVNLGVALHNLGRLGGRESTKFLKEAEKAFEDALRFLTPQNEPQEWNWTQARLGRVLQDLGRLGGPEAASNLRKAEAIYRDVLAVNEGPNNHPCGCTQADLASVLHDLGRVGGTESFQHLKNAEKAYEEALKLTSRRDSPGAWAQTKSDLATVQQDLGRRGGPDGPKYLKEAENTLKDALSLGADEMYPQDRVRTQSSQASVLQDLAQFIVPERERYLKEAETMARAAVTLSEQQAIPKPCGCTQTGLGSVLQDLGRLGGPQSAYYFTQAELAYRGALRVYPQDQFPVDWALTQASLASMFQDRAHVGPTENVEYLKNAEKTFRDALAVARLEDYSMSWVEIQAGLAGVLLDLGDTAETDGSQYLKESAAAYREIIKGFTSADFQPGWAQWQGGLGRALHELWRTENSDNLTFLNEAEAAFRASLSVIAFEDYPKDWVQIRNELGNLLLDMGRFDQTNSVRHFNGAELVFRETLKREIREDYPEDWVRGKSDLALVLKERGRSGFPNSIEPLENAQKTLQEALSFSLLHSVPSYVVSLKFRLAGVLQDLAYAVRDKPQSKSAYLQESKKLYLEVLGTTTPEVGLRDWVETKGNLASVLQDLGTLGGPESLNNLKESVKTFQEARNFGLLDRYPELWLRVELGLGGALQDLAKADTPKRGKYLKEAELVYDEALKVGTPKKYPEQWVRLQKALAELKDPLQASKILIAVLNHDADDKEAFGTLSGLYHDKLFDFVASFNLSKEWLTRHPDDLSAEINFAESQFTIGRFAACEQLIKTLLPKQDVYDDTKAALRAIEIASLIGDGKSAEVPVKLDSLIDYIVGQPANFQVVWVFDGSKHFIHKDKKLAPFDAWLGRLFGALVQNDRDSILKALQNVRSTWKQQKLRAQ
ncbi:MAG: hypothetical protein JWM21_858 [Acidobacteria bacterium]|nr:hypothetical protein [Acidobacteriota bacterium]